MTLRTQDLILLVALAVILSACAWAIHERGRR